MTEETPSSESLLDHQLPVRYQIQNVLASGGMGVVLLAEDSFLQRNVAIKVIQSKLFSDAELKERFSREVRLLSALNHPNIVKILNHGLSEKGNPYYVMELLKGQTLASFLHKNGVLSLDQFRAIFLQILSGLAWAHKHNVIHRDMNSNNIILDSDSENIHATIIDFGISRIESSDPAASNTLTATGTLIGNPVYMSPEQCSARQATPRSDLYSVGCLMYESLIGQAPFSGTSPIDLMYKHVNEKAPDIERLVGDKHKKAIARLIEKCMQKRPEERPQSAEELRTELEKIFLSISKPGESFTTPPKVEKTKPKKQLLALSAALISILLFSIFYFKTSKPSIGRVSPKTDNQVLSAKKRCSKLKKEMDQAFRVDSKNMLRRRLSIELKYLAEIQMKSADGAREAEKNLSQALLLTSARSDQVEIPLRRAECKRTYGNLKGAMEDFALAEQSALQFNHGNPGNWQHVMILNRLANFYIRIGDLPSAARTVDRLVGLWDNNDVWWDNPLEMPIGARNSLLILDLASRKIEAESERMIQLRIINTISEAILLRFGNGSLSKRTLANTLDNTKQALAIALDKIVPLLRQNSSNENETAPT